MNAFTSRETTTYYVKVLDQQLPRAVELLSDLFYHSRFESKEVEKEKQVVLEEVRMVRDDPEGPRARASLGSSAETPSARPPIWPGEDNRRASSTRPPALH